MKNIGNNRGVTVLEVLVCTAVSGLTCALWVGAVMMGNVWYTQEGVLQKIRLQHPETTEIVDTQRNIFAYSVITVKEGETVKKYYLDTDILFNYELHEVGK
ncbi:MAG: hypothetical protein Q8R40_00150 [bacterium]|nr:hypothetical protein [bacterium]